MVIFNLFFIKNIIKHLQQKWCKGSESVGNMQCAKMFIHFGLKGSFTQNSTILKMFNPNKGTFFDSLK